jgi:lactoylglutathione lyase
MARVEHVGLWTRDVDALAAFYARHFGAGIGPLYRNPAKGFASRFLDFGAGARLELMSSTMLELAASAPGAQRPGLAHVALALGSEAQVDALAAALRDAGVPLLDGPRRTGDGCYEAVVLDPDGNRIEITA